MASLARQGYPAPMCSHYQIPAQERLKFMPGITALPPEVLQDMWPRKSGVFARRPVGWKPTPGDTGVRPVELVVGRWGLVSAKTTDLSIALKLSTFNARSETARTKHTFANAWRMGQHCIVPAEAFFEPDWRTGKAVATRFTRVDGGVMGVAGLWDVFKAPDGEEIVSFTMLTINADDHPLLNQYHQPGKEKRMIVVLPEASYDAWLDAPPEKSLDFMLAIPPELLRAVPLPR